MFDNCLLALLNQDMDIQNADILCRRGIHGNQYIAIDHETDQLYYLESKSKIGGETDVFKINMEGKVMKSRKTFSVEFVLSCVAITTDGHFLIGRPHPFIDVYNKTGEKLKTIESRCSPSRISVCQCTGRVAISSIFYRSHYSVQVMDNTFSRQLYTINSSQEKIHFFVQTVFDDAGHILVCINSCVNVYDSAFGSLIKTISIERFGRARDITCFDVNHFGQLVVGQHGSDEILFIKYLETVSG